MKLPYEFWIGSRYAGLTRSKGRGKDKFVSFVAASSMAGIALGVAALIVVLSVMTGFQVQVRDRMLSVLPHIQVYNPSIAPITAVEHWQQLKKEVLKNPDVLGVSAFVASTAMLARQDSLKGVEVRGILPETEGDVSELPQQMVSGDISSLSPGRFNMVLGDRAAMQLGVGVGDTLLLMTPQGSLSPAGFSPRMRQFTVSGIFASGHAEYDANLAFIAAKDAAVLFKDESISGVRLKINDMVKAPEVAEQLMQTLPSGYIARDWTYDNRTWFAAVKTEKRMMFLILALIVAVAAFNLLSSLVMSVKDKQSDIAILRSLGASQSSIAGIFLVQGTLIGILGTGLGVMLGCLIAYNIDVIVPFIENLLGMHFLDPGIYFISQLPSQVELDEVFTVAMTSLILSFLATLYPSWRASRLQPAEVLRHD